MYTTVKELHIALDQAIQHISSSRKNSLQPEEKDWVLNEALLEYINTRINPKSNPKYEGFEDTQKRYDDLQALKKVKRLKMYVDISRKSTTFADLPVDYYHRISDKSIIYYSCNGLTFPTISSTNLPICVIEFKTDSGTRPYYVDFQISYNGNVIFDSNNYNIGNINNIETKYVLIQLALEVINNSVPELDVYWEYYDGNYYRNSFIFIHNGLPISTPNNINISYTASTPYNNTEYFNNIIITMYSYNFSGSDTIEQQNYFLSTENIDNSNINSYLKTSIFKPNSFIEGRRIKVQHDNTFYPTYIDLHYIRRPKKISLALNQTCELPERAEEIVNIAARKVKARLNDPAYRNIINENLLQE